jgi:hypothetical protein
MIRKVLLLLGALSLCAFSGCGGSNGSPDGNNLDDGRDGSGHDFDPGQGFPVEVPVGAKACSVFYEGRSALVEYHLRAQAAFRAGSYTLPKDKGQSFDLDLIESVTFGPDRVPATRVSVGSCRYSYEGDALNGAHRWDCGFEWTAGATPIHLVWKPEVWVTDGQPYQDRFVFDEEYLSYPVLTGGIDDAVDPADLMQFASCTYARAPNYRLKFTWANGDSTFLDERIWNTPLFGYVGETTPANLVRAEVMIAGSSRVETDYFKLVYAGGHHNWFEKYLVILDPPMGDVHAVYCEDTGDYGMDAPKEQLYLGADLDILNPLRRSTLDHNQVEMTPAP